jgi:hypothetical protein
MIADPIDELGWVELLNSSLISTSMTFVLCPALMTVPDATTVPDIAGLVVYIESPAVAIQSG